MIVSAVTYVLCGEVRLTLQRLFNIPEKGGWFRRAAKLALRTLLTASWLSIGRGLLAITVLV